MKGSSILFLALIVGLIWLLWYIHKHFKIPKTGNLIMVDGGLKSGKTTFSYALARKIYKRNLRGVKFRNTFRRFFNKLFSKDYLMEEEPLLYSTIPLAVPYVLVTKDLLQRNERFAYKSVLFIDEASLFADSTLVKNQLLNDDLLLFMKLFCHETKGGSAVFNSQAISDVHFSIRRCLGQTFYVRATYKWIPFFLVCEIREERYREDGQSINVYDDDLDESLRRVLIPKKVWKEFDCYCYSYLTDDLDANKNVVQSAADLKAKEIVSFNPSHCVDFIKEKQKKGGVNNEKADS